MLKKDLLEHNRFICSCSSKDDVVISKKKMVDLWSSTAYRNSIQGINPLPHPAEQEQGSGTRQFQARRGEGRKRRPTSGCRWLGLAPMRVGEVKEKRT
ncbi:hypothetical protein AKJ16_DCAP08001 [Drosera capensis]